MLPIFSFAKTSIQALKWPNTSLTVFPHIDSFRPWIVSAHLCTVTFRFPNSKKNSFRGNYMRKYGIYVVSIRAQMCTMLFLIKLDTAPQYIRLLVRGPSLTTLTRRGRFTYNSKWILSTMSTGGCRKWAKKVNVVKERTLKARSMFIAKVIKWYMSTCGEYQWHTYKAKRLWIRPCTWRFKGNIVHNLQSLIVHITK